MTNPVPHNSGLNNKYLPLEDLNRLALLDFGSRRRVEGQYSGLHATRQRGRSIEFRDYRQYQPGDELANVDWKVFGRSDRLFIKMFEHQAELTAHVLIDASASMAFRGCSPPKLSSIVLRRRSKSDTTGPPSKLDYACGIGARLAFLIMKKKDRVSLSLAQQGLKTKFPPSTSLSHLSRALTELENTTARGISQLAASIQSLSRQSRSGDLLIVVSDLLDDQEDVFTALSMWLHRGGEVIVFHTLHAEEIDPPRVENGVFIDSELSGRITLDVESIRSEYTQQMQDFIAHWDTGCRSRGIDYVFTSSATSPTDVIARYLHHRYTVR